MWTAGLFGGEVLVGDVGNGRKGAEHVCFDGFAREGLLEEEHIYTPAFISIPTLHRGLVGVANPGRS